ncbi:MAG: T9SS type A sorting domain-containing protein [Microscillaceae bacterium]|nr:T9SS type A sorting domain-containing protein [Microscillaceae bacterium]
MSATFRILFFASFMLFFGYVQAQTLPAPILSDTMYSTCQGIAFTEAEEPQITTRDFGADTTYVWYAGAGDTPIRMTEQPNDGKNPDIRELNRLDSLFNYPNTYTFQVRIEKNGTALSSFAVIRYRVTARLQVAVSGIQEEAVVCIFSQSELSASATNYTGTFTFSIERFRNGSKDTGFGTRSFANRTTLVLDAQNAELGLDTLPRNANNSYYLLKVSTQGTSCGDTEEIRFFVEEGPLAFFSFNRAQVYCPGNQVDFVIDQSTFDAFAPDLYRYVFDFGDGSAPVELNASIDPTTDFHYLRSFFSTGSYQVRLRIEQAGVQTCNGIWREELIIGNTDRFRPQFSVNGLRAGKATRLVIRNDEDLKPLRKTWYFDAFYAAFEQDFLAFRFPYQTQTIQPPLSSNAEFSFSKPGVYLPLYYNGGGNFLGLEFCPQFYGFPLVIFNEADPAALDGWISSRYQEAVLASAGAVLGNLNAQNSNLSLSDTRRSSWLLRQVTQLDSTMQEGISGQVWITNGLDNRYNNGEVSWVQSQFFSIDSLENPFLSLMVWFDTPALLDGAVLEYTLGEEEVWRRLGEIGDVGTDTEWYNERGIAAAPGDQSGENLGWSGKSQGWQRMRYSLKSIQDSLKVRFPEAEDRVFRIRLAFASLENDIAKGIFAFGALSIQDADRIVLWEQFQDSQAASQEQADSLQAILAQDAQALQLNYFIDPAQTLLYRNSPFESAIGALRELYYGVGHPQYTVMDGRRGTLEEQLAGFSRRKLDFSPYLIDLRIDLNPLRINFAIDKKDTTLFVNQHRVRMALVERGVAYEGKTYHHVVRRFLPFPQGLPLPAAGSLSLDEALPWPADLRHQDVAGAEADTLNEYPYLLVVFVQDIETQEVLQSAYRVISKADIEGRTMGESGNNPLQESVWVYPNPADEYLEIKLGEGAEADIELCNLRGQAVFLYSGLIDTFRLDCKSLAEGIYFLKIYQKNQVLSLAKVLVMH